MCHFMSMLCSKIKFEIAKNNDELFKTIWEHIKKWKGGETRDIIKLVNLHLFYQFFFSHFPNEA
jgi:hypothetical protein